VISIKITIKGKGKGKALKAVPDLAESKRGENIISIKYIAVDG
jgi:hypothetical protein